MSKTFDKEEFKERVKENVKTLYRKTIERSNTAAAVSGCFLCGEG